MEILSVGEKIKRARIYKGYTLKDVCGDEISVSKLSCIENGKIEAEDWVLEYISEKLDMDLNYLKKKVDEQINRNIAKLLDNKSKYNYGEELQYNLDLAEQYGYYNIALKIIHMLFEHYLENNAIELAQKLIGRYYDLEKKISSKYSKNIYYMDVGRYFYKNKEYIQSVNYFNNVINNTVVHKKEDYKFVIYAMYYASWAYINTDNYSEAYNISIKLLEIIDYVDDDVKKADIYQMIAIVYLKEDRNQFKKYEDKVYELYKDNFRNKAITMLKFSKAMFEIGLKENAEEYVKNAIELYPRDKDEELVKFILNCIELSVKNKCIDFILEISDEVLNIAIKLDNIKFIEKAYYLKAKILIEQNNLITAEMYMNLSLDSLNKFGAKKEIINRYMEMGKMYYDMNSTNESISFFSLAMSMQKKL